MKTAWNAYQCKDEAVSMLLFESLDGDKNDRMVSPISISNTDYKNTLNTFMDHVWDGFYTGQIRLSRFPSLIQGGYANKYRLDYAGTPPSNQRFKFIGYKNFDNADFV